jgi:4-oxalocrotonate tautomerase
MLKQYNLGIMPHIIVKLWKGKSEAQKKKLAEELTQTAMSVIGSGEESFSVAIEDIDPNDWKENVYLPDILGQKEKLYKQPGYKM